MRRIPRSLGCRAYSLVWWEEGAFCVERSAVFPLLPFYFPLFTSVIGACLLGGRGLMAGLSGFTSHTVGALGPTKSSDELFHPTLLITFSHFLSFIANTHRNKMSLEILNYCAVVCAMHLKVFLHSNLLFRLLRYFASAKNTSNLKYQFNSKIRLLI